MDHFQEFVEKNVVRINDIKHQELLQATLRVNKKSMQKLLSSMCSTNNISSAA